MRANLYIPIFLTTLTATEFKHYQPIAVMGILDRFKPGGKSSPASSTMDPEKKPQILEVGAKQIFRPRIIAMAIIVSMGGFIFGMSSSS